MPALSCPRCCSAYNPRYVRFEASVWPKIPKTPHSSLNLSITTPGVEENYKCTASRNSPRGFEIFSDRCRPQVLGVGHGLVNRHAAVDGDRHSSACYLSDAPRRNLLALRKREQLSFTPGRDRHDDAPLRFAQPRRAVLQTCGRTR